MTAYIFITTILFYCIGVALALSLQPRGVNHAVDVSSSPAPVQISRRDVMQNLKHSSAAAAAALTLTTSKPSTSNAASSGLAAKLSARDPSQLKNSVFNIPPNPQTLPQFLHGSWDVTMKFRGFIFPSTNIAKDKLIANVGIPGFQKLSIAAVGDVGRETTTYQMNIDPKTREWCG